MNTSFPSVSAAARLRRRPLGQYRYVRLRWRVFFTVVDAVGNFLALIARTLRRSRTAPACHPRTILLVQLDHLGDAILSTGLVAALRRRWPRARIEALASTANAEIFAALPAVDRVYVSRANRFARNRLARLGWIGALFYWGLRMRLRGVDLAIDVRGEFPLAALVWLAGARVRLGWNCGGGGFLLTHSPRYEPGRSEVDSRRALLAELGITAAGDDPTAFARPQFTTPPHVGPPVAQRLLRGDLLQPAAGPRVVLHVGAGSAAKRWPVEHWRELLRRLRAELDARVILVGSPDERGTALAILGQRPALCVTNWTGALTLLELAAVLEQSDLLVGADSGPAHLAAAVGTPVVTLFSGTNTARQWAPVGSQVTVLLHSVDCAPCHRQSCALGDHPCMRGLSPGQVWDAVLSCLSPLCEGAAR